MPKGFRIDWTPERESFIRDNYHRMDYLAMAAAMGLSHDAVSNKARRMGLTKGRHKIAPVVRFWSQVEKSDGCWEWQGHTNERGYGLMHFKGKQHGSHRLAYLFTHGAIPRGAFICHHCDNPKCVRPDHLYAGDSKSNVRDAVERERHAFGEKNGQSVLTAPDVLRMRDLYRNRKATMTQIAREYGVGPKTVSHVMDGTTWGAITGGQPIRRGARRFGSVPVTRYDEEVARLFRLGKSQAEIKDALGLSQWLLRQSLRRQGLKYQSYPRPSRPLIAA